MSQPSQPKKRRWTSTLATPIPPGPKGQPGHEVGAQVSVIDLVHVPGIGDVSISVPRPSSLLLVPAALHLKQAEEFCQIAKTQIERSEWVQDGHELSFTDEELVYDFFGEAMSGILLAYTALDNLLNELLPLDFEYKTEKEIWDRQRIESTAGVERKLTQFVPAATDRGSLAEGAPELYLRVMELKRLRDDIGHAKLERGFGGPRQGKTIFSDLFEVDLVLFVNAVSSVGVFFGVDE